MENSSHPADPSRDLDPSDEATSEPGLDSSEPKESEPEKVKPKKAKKKPRSLLQEIPILVVIALLFSFFIQTFLARVYLIPSESMEPTLHGCAGCTGDRIVVDKVVYRFSDPQPGDVVVFKGPDSWNTNYQSKRSSNTIIRGAQELGSFVGLVPPDENDLVKRVIATGGQTVSCTSTGGLQVNGKTLNEPYLQGSAKANPCRAGAPFTSVTVPEGNVWVMGDNRLNSRDSRFHQNDELMGTVPVDNVIGKARFIIFPFSSRWGGIDSPDNQPGQ